ncbi:YdcF family protein [Rummeliibacillus stabekisii]|uniref:YdcF family protein n=1 Tax=Rummeliibacillus stabekisii TaxID=241244 RepID=UPI00182B364C|nr:YdcF family protein [Rummeliibacillus stabekisii]MBB5171444.1 uncharacterized SAM-binding protein YcdF (DUF218 family) [Rummeliibacillus stabekisii]
MKRKKMWIIVVIVLVIAGFWVLTSKWLAEGEKPRATGANKYLVVLGAKVKKGAVPSKSLAYRLDAALEYAKKYPKVLIIVTGGQGPDEDATEASVMKNYLVDRGVDEKRIKLEDKSTTTYENLVNAKKIIGNESKKITIVSNDYHLARAKMLAENVGLDCDVIPAKTPKSVEAKSRLRERLALLKTVVLGK